MKLKLQSKKDFVNDVLNPISNLNDKTVLKIEKDKITSLTASTDATLVLYSETKTQAESDKLVNVPDIKKLIRVIDCVETEDISLEINSNNINTMVITLSSLTIY